MGNKFKMEGAIPTERIELILSMHKTNNFAQLLDIKIHALDEGYCRLGMSAGEHCTNPYGDVHGGATATLVDIAMGVAVRTLGLQPVTVELTVNYLGPVHKNDALEAEGKVIHQGSTLLLAECLVQTAAGQAVARGRALFTKRRDKELP